MRSSVRSASQRQPAASQSIESGQRRPARHVSIMVSSASLGGGSTPPTGAPAAQAVAHSSRQRPSQSVQASTQAAVQWVPVQRTSQRPSSHARAHAA